MLMATSVTLALVLGATQETVTVPAPIAAVDMAAFDAKVQIGQAQYLAGQTLVAARTWVEAARMLPLTDDQRGNFVAIHGYIADAYDHATRGDDPALMREALAVLDDLAVKFLSAYPGVPLAPRIDAVRERLRGRLVAVDARATPTQPILLVDHPIQPIIKPWRPLAYGGGAVLAGSAAMIGMFTYGFIRTKQYEDGLQTFAVTCQINTPDAPCGKEYDKYRMASTLQLTGMILGPVMLATGATMLFVAMKRKRAAEQPSMVPLVSRGMYGLGIQGRF